GGGQRLLLGQPLAGGIPMASGRTAFEIVQNALPADRPVGAALSARSGLANDLAREARLTLIGFVRGATFNVYTGIERLDSLKIRHEGHETLATKTTKITKYFGFFLRDLRVLRGYRLRAFVADTAGTNTCSARAGPASRGR